MKLQLIMTAFGELGCILFNPESPHKRLAVQIPCLNL